MLMARAYLLALPTPPTPRLAQIVEDLRLWAPGLRAEPSAWHVPLHHVTGRASRLLSRLRRQLADAEPLPCLLQGLGSGPDPRSARSVWANIEAPGIDTLNEALEGIARLRHPPPAQAQVPLAHLPRPTDVRSFLNAHAMQPFCFGRIERVALLEARAVQGVVQYREIGSARLGGARRAPRVWHPWTFGFVARRVLTDSGGAWQAPSRPGSS